MRENIIYRCTECGEENYIGTKDKKKHPDRVEINKYCKQQENRQKFILFHSSLHLKYNIAIKLTF